MTMDVVTQEPARRGRRWLARGTVAGFGLGLGAVLLALTTGSSAGAVPDVGAGTPLTSDITLAQLLEELQGDDVVAGLDIGAGTTFAGAFDTDEYAALQLAADGSEWIYNADDLAFSATATGTFATDLDTSATFQVFVHAVAHDAPATPSLVVLLEATNSTSGTDLPLHDLVPVLRGEKPAVIARAGQVDAPLFGVSHFQGDVPIDVATLPSGAVDFVKATLNVADLGDEIGGPDVADDKVRVSGMVNPRRVLLADFDMIGADGSATDLTGVLADSFPEFAKFRSPSATAVDLGALDLNYTLPASVPTWTPEGWLSLPDDGDPDTDPPAWTINTKYDELLARLESVAQGPEWDIHLPVVFPEGTTFSPNFMISDVLADPLQSKQTVVGGTIGNWVPEGRDDITVSVSANFSKQGSDKFADFFVEATLPNADPLNPTPVNANGDLFLTKGSGDWSVTLSLGFDTAFSIDRIQNIFGGSDPESGSGVPDDLLSASVEDLRIVLSIASGGEDESVDPPKKNPPVGSVGVTGKVMVSPFTEPGEPVPEAIAGGASLMFFSSFGGGDTPTIMFGVAPSFRRIGGDDPASEPVYLSEVLGQPVDPNSDLKVYDPERPDTGFGLIYSSKTANIGGAPDADRLETPVNVAQWLMPMFGFDGSDEALDASTSTGSAGCGECSFRADFAPTKRFVVPGQGLTAAGSLIMPNPIGTRLDWADSCADPDSDSCQSALGFLGQLSLDSRVTLSGTFPLGIAPGAPPALGLELKISLRNDLPVERPTWLNDGRFSLSLKVDPAESKVKLGLSATLQIAIKQGLSPEDAADLFPGDPEAIIDHMLPAVDEDADCARSGVTLQETSSEGGFQEGSFYCHDLLEGTITANLSITPTSVEVKLLGDLKAVKLIDDDGPKDLSNTEPDTVNGWQPVGMDKFQINQLTIELGFKTGPTGFSATFGAGASVSILTTPRITASAAISLEFTPATVVLQGFRVNIGQLTLANVIEIYEWISNEDVPTDDLPGIALRNLALSIGFQDLPNLCINNGFYLSGDLYVSDDFDAFNEDPPAYQCNNTPGPGFGKLIPSPDEPCDQADIALGCVAGIRLLVNDRGVFGDAFIAAFDAGPLHLYDPTPAVDDGDPNTDDAPGRAVSVTFKITSSGVKIDVFGGAALGGSKDPTTCSDGQYCDAWAKGELTARIRANILNGVDVKVFGRVKSGLPGLSFQVIAAGEVHLQGATALVNLFTKGEIPQGSLMLHVELANADPAPDLDFAGAAQAEVDRAFGNALAALSDAARVIELLESDPSAAMDILDEYVADAQSRGITVDPALIGLIRTVDDILAAAESAGQSTNLDWLLKGFYFPSIPPGVPNLGDVFLGVNPPRCDGLNYGYGPEGSDTPQAAGYPYDYCFLYPTGYTDGICDGVGIPDAECTLQKVAEVLVVRPMLELVLAGVDVSSEVVGFAHDVTTMVLEGELFRIDCASFDLTAEVAGTIGAPDFFGEIQLGLFLTFFGQPIGISFEWFVDTEQDGLEQFGENIENLVNSLLETFTGTTESTCWTEEEIKAFIEDDTDDPTETGEPPPPPPAVMQSAEIVSDAVLDPELGANVTREADTSTLTVTFDRAVTTERALNVDWGDGSAVQPITIAAGSATVTTTHVYVDDNPTATPSDVRTAVITDTSNSQVLSRAVTVLNIAPSGVSITPTALSINENQTVGVTVSFTDPGTADSHKAVVEWAPGVTTSVTVPANARSVVVSPYQFLQNPISQKALIKATVTDDDSGAGHGSREIDVKNVAPEITETALLGTDPVRESIPRNYRISWTDPGTLDGHAVHVKWNWDGVEETTSVPIVWDEIWLVKDGKLYDFKQPINQGTVGIPLPPGLTRSLTLAHTYVDDTPTGTPADSFRPLVRIVDLPDTARDTEDVTIQVNDVAPVVSRDVATQPRQYSDKLADITVTASDINGDVLTATTSFSRDAGAATAGLPAGITLGAKSCVENATTGRQTCTWKLTGTAGVAAGTYVITVRISDEDTLFNEVTTTLVVTPEDAVVRFDPTNPIDIRVTAPGSNASKPFTLKLMVEEKEPDLPAEWAAPGDISKAVVTVKLIPIGPGSTVTATCTQVVTGTGYAQVLTLTCPFTNVAVNTYYVDVKVDGGFYAGGDEDVVNVSDPSLGFTAGGGWFYWPGTTDRTTFGYTMKYTKKLTNVQGNLVMIRHLADGTSYRVKSNSISGLAIGKGTGFNWASFTGKNTYRDRTWVDAVGNYTFNAYVEDWGEPGTKDRFWIEVKDKDRQLVAVVSIGRTATVGAVTLNGGNIQAPLPSSIA